MNAEFDDKLDRLAARLAKEVRPEHDLWPGIARAIAEPARPRWVPMLAQAAAVVLLVGASSGVTWYWMKDRQAPITQISPDLVFEQASFGRHYTLGPGFQSARNSLAAELDATMARLSSESRGEIETNLEVIHKAIIEINGALEKDPGNVLLQEKLLRAYREELTLLRRVGGLARNVMVRNDI